MFMGTNIHTYKEEDCAKVTSGEEGSKLQSNEPSILERLITDISKEQKLE